ncbi:MAG TPA: mandelate racemase/muconate lactonizing enzyme family protein [Bryobacterales bacterium]|nr:mandelate racemase/muconate lactonizing enzyme family protein [Bryobacterales bacterium]
MNRRNFLTAFPAVSAGALRVGPLPAACQVKAKLKMVEARVYLVSVGGRNPVLVQILTDQGIHGVGEAAVAYGTGATAAAGMIKDLAEQFLPGKDPFRIEAIWSEMYDHSFWAKGGGSILFAGISAIEQALWDIKGKALGLPIYEMLGGKIRDKARVYANGWSFRCIKPADFAREAERVVKDGYTAIKFYPLASAEMDPEGHIRHVSHRSVDREAESAAIARVKAVRDAVGPKIDLMLDMSAELTTDAVIRIGRRLEGEDILFLEEPVDPFDVEALKKFSEQVHIPVAVGERLYTRYGFRRVLELHAADIVQPDVGNTGGIMETKKIAAMAETYNMRVQPHNCASPVSTAAALQVDACIPNFMIQETYPYRVPEHFQLVDRAPELEIRNSFVPISDRPGLGLELVEERVRPFLWARCKL